MPTEVLGIVGSPRSSGSTAALVRRALEGARDAGATTGELLLGDMDVGGCVACMSCRETGECALRDDMQAVYRALRSCDMVVLGTPIYFFTMTAQMKAFTDRLFAVLGDGMEKRLGSRPALLVVTQGADSPELFSREIDSMRRAWEMAGIVVGSTVLGCAIPDSGPEPGGSLFREAYEAGRELVVSSGA